VFILLLLYNTMMLFPSKSFGAVTYDLMINIIELVDCCLRSGVVGIGVPQLQN